MKDDFKRLLQAAYETRGLVSASEIARALTLGGFKASDQTMTNWRTRGVSSAGRLAAARILGCRSQFIETGELPIKDTRNSADETSGDSIREQAILSVFRQLSRYDQESLMAQAVALVERSKISEQLNDAHRLHATQ